MADFVARRLQMGEEGCIAYNSARICAEEAGVAGSLVDNGIADGPGVRVPIWARIVLSANQPALSAYPQRRARVVQLLRELAADPGRAEALESAARLGDYSGLIPEGE